MDAQKGNILLVTFFVVLVVFFILGFGYFYLQIYLQKTIIKKSNTNIEPSPTSSLASPTAILSSSFCQPDRIYVDLQACSCPEGTTKTIETPEGGEEAVLICKSKDICKGEDFYEKEVLSLNYKIYTDYVTISSSGCCISSSRGLAGPESFAASFDLYPGQEFYYTNTGKEQTVSVRLEKIENNKAYFVFSYGAAPPACETVSGCGYTCQFVEE